LEEFFEAVADVLAEQFRAGTTDAIAGELLRDEL
jgi:hypothetical protein